MAADTFPIRRLTSVALAIVLKYLNPVEVFNLSQLSKKMKDVVKREYKNTGQVLHVAYRYSVCISTRFIDDTTGHFLVRYNNIRRTQPERHVCVPTFISYHHDVLEGATELLKKLMDVFGFSIAKIHIDLTNAVNHRSIIRWVNTYAQNTPMIIIQGSGIEFGAYIWVLENIESPNNVDFMALPEKYLPKETLSLRVNKLKIFFGEFVRLNDLQALNGAEYNIGNVNINDEQLNQFLRELVAGSNPNMRKLRLEAYGRAVIDNVLKDLKARKINDCTWKFDLENGNKVTLFHFVFDEEWGYSNIEIFINRD